MAIAGKRSYLESAIDDAVPVDRKLEEHDGITPFLLREGENSSGIQSPGCFGSGGGRGGAGCSTVAALSKIGPLYCWAGTGLLST